MYTDEPSYRYFAGILYGVQFLLIIIAWNTEGIRGLAVAYYFTLTVSAFVDAIIWLAGGYFSIQALLFLGALKSLTLRCKFGDSTFKFKTTG